MRGKGIRKRYVLNDKLILGRKLRDLLAFSDRMVGYLGEPLDLEGEKEVNLGPGVYLDLMSPHVMLICGKKGYGKSYSLGIILEEFLRLDPELRQKLSMVVIDTMGIFWALRYENINKVEVENLEVQNLRPRGFSDVDIIIPKKFAPEYDKLGIDYTDTLVLNPGELEDTEWCYAFGIDYNSPMGIAISNLVMSLQDEYGDVYSIDTMINYLRGQDDTGVFRSEGPRVEDFPVARQTKDALLRRFIFAKNWGIFYDKNDREYTKIVDLIRPGKVSVVNIYDYSTEIASGWGIRTLVAGLISKKIFELRSRARRLEQLQEVKGEGLGKSESPLVWMLIDEAHRFAPAVGATAASAPLAEWARQGRHPGLSLVLATQRPGSIDSNILSQCDIIMSHRLTSKPDVDALARIQPTYARGLQDSLDLLPADKSGYALVIDDNTEQFFTLKLRNRFSWHAGDDARALHEVPDEGTPRSS